MNQLQREIDQAKFLYLRELKLSEDNELKIILQVGKLAEQPITQDELNKENEVVAKLLTGATQIISDETCASYEVFFDVPLCHIAQDESYTKIQENEEFSGRFFRKYSKSIFLEFFESSMNAQLAYSIQNHSINHFGIITSHSIIDIVAVGAPEIRRVYQGGVINSESLRSST